MTFLEGFLDFGCQEGCQMSNQQKREPRWERIESKETRERAAPALSVVFII